MKQSSNSGQSRKAGHQKRRLVILVAVLLVGLVALAFLYTNDGRKLFGLANPLVSQQQAETLNTSTTDQSTTDLSDRKFDIPELGITLTLPDGLEGLEYGRVVTYTQAPGEYIGFTTKSLREAKDATEYCSADNRALGFIGRFSTDPLQLKVNASKEDTFKIGDYYYSYFLPQQPCLSKIEDIMDLQNKKAELLQTALKTAEAIR